MSDLLGEKPLVMGIVNVTPDSFSDGGRFLNPDAAIEHGLRLAKEGADILDIGGESTRPGAAPVSPEDEINRVIPVIEGLRGAARYLSIDTRHAATMRAAIAAGANMVNDVTALSGDTESLRVVADARIPVCLMHMQGSPVDMQKNASYQNVVDEILSFLHEKTRMCISAGIEEKHIIIDPGIGFGKTLEHNLLLLGKIRVFVETGFPVLLGTSRKSFISSVMDGTPVEDRMPGSLAAALWGYTQGVRIFRVHDVAQTRQALAVYEAIFSRA